MQGMPEHVRTCFGVKVAWRGGCLQHSSRVVAGGPDWHAAHQQTHCDVDENIAGRHEELHQEADDLNLGVPQSQSVLGGGQVIRLLVAHL